MHRLSNFKDNKQVMQLSGHKNLYECHQEKQKQLNSMIYFSAQQITLNS
jgi:hypothetical protein